DEVTGEARPLHVIDEIGHATAVTDEERNAQVKENIKRISARVTKEGTTPKLPAHDRTAILVFAGPSLQETWPSIKIAAYQSGTDIFTVSNAHRFLTERGIYPDAHIDCDPREHKGRQIGEPSHRVKYWLASCCHPSYLDKLKGYNIALWHSYN